MKKLLILVLSLLLCVFLFSGCNAIASKITSAIIDKAGDSSMEPVEEYTETPEDTAEPESTETPEESDALETEQPDSPASTLSGDRADLSDEEMLKFFSLVVFSENPDGELVYKWMNPIVVSVSGDYNDQDAEQLTNIFDTLNQYDGFPGITYADAATGDADINMEVKFVTADVLQEEMPNWNGEQPLYAAFADDNYSISQSVIYLVPDLVTDQAERNYLLTWGVFYTLGFTFDNGMYYDSIFNPNYIDEQLGSTFASPVSVDWYLLSMLYYETVQPGMDADQAIEALNQ